MKKPTIKMEVLSDEDGIKSIRRKLELIDYESFALLNASETMEEYDLPSRIRTAARDLRNCLEEVKGGQFK